MVMIKSIVIVVIITFCNWLRRRNGVRNWR